MGDLLFSPTGRIGSGQFMKGATILIGVTLVLTLLPVLAAPLAFLNILGLVMLWCWIVLWIKRYHDGGKSGWMCLIPIIVWLSVGMIVSAILSGMFEDPDAAAALLEATEAGDMMTALKLGVSGGMTVTGQIVNAVAAAVVSFLVAMIFNSLIKHDDQDNHFGPVAGTS